jgi:hypothetical protein
MEDLKYVMYLMLDPFSRQSNYKPYGRYLKDYDGSCIVTTNNIFDAKQFNHAGDVHKYWHAHKALSMFGIQVVEVGE